MKEGLKRIWGYIDPAKGWSKQRKVFDYVIIFLLVILLVCAWTVFRSERIVERVIEREKIVEVPAKTAAPTIKEVEVIKEVVKEVVKEVIPQSIKDRLTELEAENAKLKAPPQAVVWPKADRIITSDEARQLLTNTFPNRRMTGAHFRQASLYTPEQFKEIRSKMPAVITNLPWPSFIDKTLGMFQEPGIEDLPVGWAYPTYDPMYLIVILFDTNRPKIFSFDPIDKTKIWEVPSDPRVEAAIVR